MRLEIKPKRKVKAKKCKKVFCLSALLIFVFTIVILISTKTSTMLRAVAKSELESIAYDIVGKVVEEELSSGERFDNIIRIDYNKEGKVSAITSDAQKLNLLKIRITNRLSEIMMEREYDTIAVPFGSLTGIDFFTGRGPKLRFKIYWVSGVGSDFRTSFTEAGINQTNYRIMLDFEIEAGMMLAGREVGNNIGTSICVAETVIVGEIPDFLYDKR